ncbi:cation transporter [Subtercola vilae]|uniref:Cation transporter n=1 Tax=Subtercola vilae TaxID=2056433 RepID=A0A4T2C4K6_9MICO|nr:cation transporter [Subtercola vilae]
MRSAPSPWASSAPHAAASRVAVELPQNVARRLVRRRSGESRPLGAGPTAAGAFAVRPGVRVRSVRAASCENRFVTVPDEVVPHSTAAAVLLRRGRRLEWFTLGWNIVGVIVLAVLVFSSSSIALAGFGLDSFIEIGASTVVLWELAGVGERRRQRALRLIGGAFVLLAVYLLIQSVVALATAHHASASVGGIVWTGVTAAVMFTLAAAKGRTGRELRNPVLQSEGRVTFVDGLLAVAVLVGILLNLMLGWWWADPVAGLVIVYYAAREAIQIFSPTP